MLVSEINVVCFKRLCSFSTVLEVTFLPLGNVVNDT
jgi:hypothetical protein